MASFILNVLICYDYEQYHSVIYPLRSERTLGLNPTVQTLADLTDTLCVHTRIRIMTYARTVVHPRQNSVDYGHTKTPSMHLYVGLGSAALAAAVAK